MPDLFSFITATTTSNLQGRYFGSHMRGHIECMSVSPQLYMTPSIGRHVCIMAVSDAVDWKGSEYNNSYIVVAQHMCNKT